MPETKTQRRPATKGQAGTRKPRVVKPRAAVNGKHDAKSAVERTTELSEDVLKSLDDGARSSIEAVRRFVETVDRALPPRGEGPSRREEITDSALEMAQRLVHTQYDFLRKVMDSAGKSLTRSDDAK
jgi:hypothetical protein